jgi:hypothetical protein
MRGLISLVRASGSHRVAHGPGFILRDPLTGVNQTFVNGGRLYAGRLGSGVDCFGANDRGLRTAAWSTTIITQFPITIMVAWTQMATAQSALVYYGLLGSAGTRNWVIGVNSATATTLEATFGAVTLSVTNGTPLAGTNNIAVACCENGRQRLYVNGTLIATGSSAITSIGTVTSPVVCCGCQDANQGTNIGALVYETRLYNRALSDRECESLSRMPWSDVSVAGA